MIGSDSLNVQNIGTQRDPLGVEISAGFFAFEMFPAKALTPTISCRNALGTRNLPFRFLARDFPHFDKDNTLWYKLCRWNRVVNRIHSSPSAGATGEPVGGESP